MTRSQNKQSSHRIPEETLQLADHIIKGSLEGLTNEQIADKAGVTELTIWNLRNSLDWQKWVAPTAAKLLWLIAEIQADGNKEAAASLLAQYLRMITPREIRAQVTAETTQRPSLDFSALTREEREQLKALLDKARPKP